MTAAILSALNILTKPLVDGPKRDALSSHQEALVAGLRANISILQERLHGDSSFQEVKKMRETVITEAAWFSLHTQDTSWSFVQECLVLFLTLARHLSAELEIFQQTPSPSAVKVQTPEMAPPLPPDILSVSQQKTLGAALQFVVSLGLCPYLAAGVGVPLGCRSAFGAMVEKLVCSGDMLLGRRRLLITTSVFLKLSELSSLATLVFTRHLGDLMAALCQLGYQTQQEEESSSDPKKIEELTVEECQTCKEALKSLLGKVYQPIVIKELLILQAGPKQSATVVSGRSSRHTAVRAPPAWLRRLCGQLLSERLMQPNGVQAVVRAVLGGGTGGDSDWKKCECVARILATPPQQSVSAECYYSQLCPQILDLLHLNDKLTAQQFQLVATRAVLSIVQKKPSFAHQHLLKPLLAPLHRCTTASGPVEEWELSRCVDDVYKIWVVGNSPSAPLLKALDEVLPVIFQLFCFTRQNVSHLRVPCQMILLWYLSHKETFTAVSALKQLCGLQREKRNTVAEGFHFSPGSDGGVRLSSRDSCSDEDDALYEKLSGEQWSLECLMQLLAELKDSDLPGDYFLDLLRELTSRMAADDEEKAGDEQVDVSALTLVQLEQQLLDGAETRGQSLALLQALALMVECLQHTLLLRKNTQVVDFLVSLLQRACVGLDRPSGSGFSNPVQSETLSMAIGLIATLLSGLQPSAEDYSSMSRLLPPLETLSQKHPDVFIQELASNLRAVIATHGAFQPENLTAASQPHRDSERTTGGKKLPSRKKQKIRSEEGNSEAAAGLTSEDRSSEGRPASSEDRSSEGRPASSEDRSSEGCPASSEDRSSEGRPASSEDRSSEGCPASSEDRSSEGCPASSEDRSLEGRPASSEDRSSEGRPASSEDRSSEGCPASSEDRSSEGRPASSEDRSSEGCPASFKDRSSEGRPASSEDRSSEGCPASSEDRSSEGRPASSAERLTKKGGGRTFAPSELQPPSKTFSECLLEACDPDVPTRAFALRVLTQMVRNRNQEVARAQEKVLMLFLENLEHEDSFVYLSAVQGLAVLADFYPERILERLLRDFQRGPSLPSSSTERSLETRLKLGEVLMRASRAMGDLAPHLGHPLVGAFLLGTRDPEPTIRASSLSNLGELCQRLDYSLGTLAQELSSCLNALIKTEKEAEVRRAAVHVITLLLRGLSDKSLQVLRDVMLDLYRALKWVVRSDPDDVAVLHAQLALEELDGVMMRFIFPEQKLEKKIIVLP